MSYRRCNTDWMRSSFGISVHWTAGSVRQNGSRLPFEAAVERFDPERFADALASIGAQHCIFTLTHAKEYLAMPNPVLESLLPGRTTRRDLIGELITALKKHEIRFIAYYNHSCNGNDDPEWRKACGYADGVHGDLDRFAKNICDIIAWIGKRYGSDLRAWWFDSSYSVDPHGPNNTVSCEMGDWRFPWDLLNRAAKSGNPDAAVAFNSGIGKRFLYAECQDYYCGESSTPDQMFSPEALPGMQDHRWFCMDDPEWVFNQKRAETGFCEPRFSDSVLKHAIQRHLDEGIMVSLNVLIDQDGNLNPKALEQLKRIQQPERSTIS